MSRVLPSPLLAGLLVFMLNPAGAGASIIEIAYADVTGEAVATFDDVAGSAFPGTPYDGVLMSGGLTLGESFAGQSLLEAPDLAFEFPLPGNVNGPLAVIPGGAGENLAVLADAGGNHSLAGISPAGVVGGRGAVAVAFPVPQAEVGFTVLNLAGNGSFLAIQVFDQYGTALGSFQPTFQGPAPAQSFGFRVEAGLPIWGMSISQNDLGTVTYDDFKFMPVPEPGTLGLLGLGALAVAHTLRKRLNRRPGPGS